MSEKEIIPPKTIQIRIDPKLHQRLINACETLRLDKSEVLRTFIESYTDYVESKGEKRFDIPSKLRLDIQQSHSLQENSGSYTAREKEILTAAERIAKETVLKLIGPQPPKHS